MARIQKKHPAESDLSGEIVHRHEPQTSSRGLKGIFMGLTEQLASYGAYHRDPRNKRTHFIGVPLVVLSIFILLGWLRWTFSSSISVSAAHLFFAATSLYYFKTDLRLALTQLPASLALLLVAERISQLPWGSSLGIFLVTFLLGWFFQLLGHYYEGKRPALVDNFWQVFNAPLFLAAETLFSCGLYHKLKDRVEEATRTNLPG